MPKIQSRTDLTSVRPEEYQKHSAIAISEMADTMNGGLEFDKNINSQHVTVKFTQANTDTAISHSMGRSGLHYWKAKSSADCSIYDGAKASTNNTIYLRSTAVATVVLILY